MPWICFLLMSRDSAIADANFPFVARSITFTHSSKVNTFLLLEVEVEAIFRTVATHLQLYTLISYILVVQSVHKRWYKVDINLQQNTCIHVVWSYSVEQQPPDFARASALPRSGGCWSSLAGAGRSTQGLFGTKSPVHGISVVKTRWSWNTRTVNCRFTLHNVFESVFSAGLSCLQVE